MCLDINTRIHKVHRVANSRPNIFPVLTEQPLLVWKRLVFDCLNESHVSPYRRDRYTFGKLKNAPRRFLGRSSIQQHMYGGRYRTRHIVEEGIHAYFALNRENARRYASFCHDEQIFPAVIPAGSKIFIGKNHDVVSTALIVYMDMESLLAAYQPGEATPVDSNSLRPIAV